MQQENKQQAQRWPFLIVIGMVLQGMTNRLFMRKVVIAMGVLKNKGPAMIVQVKRVFGKSKELVMDLKSFLELADAMTKVDMSTLEREGYTMKKVHGMTTDFHIPSWAFPQALFEALLAAREILLMMKAYKDSTDKLSIVLQQAGVPKEEVDKFKAHAMKPIADFQDSVEKKDNEKPTLH